jgi:surface protein
MFAIIPSVTDLSIGNWNTSKATDMSAMFVYSNQRRQAMGQIQKLLLNGVTYTAWDNA